MNFSQITGAVRDLWDFIWPPVILLCVLTVVCRLLAPELTARVTSRVRSAFTASIGDVSLRSNLDQFGLGKILPAVALFVIVFLLYVSRALVIATGDLIPPTVFYQPDTALARKLSDEEIICLFAVYPNSNLSRIERLAVEQGKLKQDSDSHWEERSGRMHIGFITTKFVVVWALAWAVTEAIATRRILRTLARFVGVVAVCVLVAFVFLTLYLYSIDQMFFDKAARLQQLLPASRPCKAASVPAPVSAALERRLQSKLAREWWHLEFGPSEYMKWVMRDMFGGI
jgi:hypothetical protein